MSDVSDEIYAQACALNKRAKEQQQLKEDGMSKESYYTLDSYYEVKKVKGKKHNFEMNCVGGSNEAVESCFTKDMSLKSIEKELLRRESEYGFCEEVRKDVEIRKLKDNEGDFCGFEVEFQAKCEETGEFQHRIVEVLFYDKPTELVREAEYKSYPSKLKEA